MNKALGWSLALVLVLAVGSAGLLGRCQSAVTTTSMASTTTSVGTGLSGTSPEHRLGSDTALKLGDAVISYFAGKVDRAAVVGLVAPGAEGGLDQMLSSLGQPTSSRVVVTTDRGAGSGVTQVVLAFTDAKSHDAEFTLTVEVRADETSRITAISAGNTVE